MISGWAASLVASWAFDRLNEQDTQALLRRCAPDIRHSFAGHHALGGVRTNQADFRAWLERLFRLFPELKFEIHDVLVAGPPWHMRIAVTWRDTGTTADEQPYTNTGVHLLRLRWGRLVELRANLDSQHLADVLDEMARNGIAEAGADPICST